jgi:hypothetical protein
MTLDYIDDRLHQWARWALKQTGPQGYSRETIIYRMMRSGVLIRGQGYKPEVEASDEERTDKAVTALRDRRPEIWEVLVTHYLAKGTLQQKCADLSVSRRTYFDRLATGRDRVDAYLMALTDA